MSAQTNVIIRDDLSVYLTYLLLIELSVALIDVKVIDVMELLLLMSF